MGGGDRSAMPAVGPGSDAGWPEERIWKMVRYVRRFAETDQDKTDQDKTDLDKADQDKTDQDKTDQDKTDQDKTDLDKASQESN
jgi:hypothetical protein